MFLSVVSRVILVDHWCAKMALVNLGKFMASPALVQLVVLWTRNPQCSPAPLPTCPGSTISSAETSTTNTVRNDFVRKIIKKINVQKHNLFPSPLTSLCSIWLWRTKGPGWCWWKRILHELSKQLQQQSSLPVEPSCTRRKSCSSSVSQFLPGGESAVFK